MAGGEYIASHTITYEYIITDDPHHGLLLLISPWSGENSRRGEEGEEGVNSFRWLSKSNVAVVTAK